MKSLNALSLGWGARLRGRAVSVEKDPVRRLSLLRQTESAEWSEFTQDLDSLTQASCDRRQKSRARFNEALRKLGSRRMDE